MRTIHKHGQVPHDLMNEAREWLHYARNVSGLLADLIHESDSVDCKRVSLSLEAIEAMTQVGLRRMGEAHAAWVHELARLSSAR
jgi:hypothetical protein